MHNSLDSSRSPHNPHALPSGLFPFLWYFLRRHKVLVAFYVALPLLAGFYGPFNSRIMKWILDLLPTLRDRGDDLGRDISLLHPTKQRVWGPFLQHYKPPIPPIMDIIIS